MSFKEQLREDYQLLFGQSWPAWVGGLAIGALNVFLFIFYQPWTTLDGVLNWGDSLLGLVGLVRSPDLSPLTRSGSLIDFGLLFGAMLSALLAGQWAIRVGPRRELLKGLIGGLMLGSGAALARGCNIGGFFSSTSAFGMNGLAMAVGLAGGAFIGTRYLVWEVNHTSDGGAADVSVPAASSKKSLQPWFGAAILLGLLAWAFVYGGQGLAERGVILLFGVVLGLVSQRSRVCFVAGFRDPFLTGETRQTRAMLLALLVSVVGFAVVKSVTIEKVDEFVRPTFWLGSALGGLIFGVGMTLAGGCGGGTIWRAGEGHVKLWLALIGYILSASFVRDLLARTRWQEQLGASVYLPDVLGGWAPALGFMFIVLVGWYLFVRWNEATHKLAAI